MCRRAVLLVCVLLCMAGEVQCGQSTRALQVALIFPGALGRNSQHAHSQCRPNDLYLLFTRTGVQFSGPEPAELLNDLVQLLPALPADVFVSAASVVLPLEAQHMRVVSYVLSNRGDLGFNTTLDLQAANRTLAAAFAKNVWNNFQVLYLVRCVLAILY